MKKMVFRIPYESVEDIPREEYKNLFKQYWTFIARNHLDYKPGIVNTKGKWIYVHNCCFACEYARRSCGKYCRNCPLKLYRAYGIECLCSEINTLYYLWICTGSPRWAMEVAQLEWED